MQRQNGFTIVEALVAMAILSVALVALYGIGGNLLRTSTHIGASDRAVLYAQSKLELLALNAEPLPPHEEGTEDGYHWEVTATPVPEAALWSRQILQDVRLSVTWQTETNSRSLTVATRHLGRVKS